MTDLEPLKNFKELRVLSISGKLTQDITPLESCLKLEELNMNRLPKTENLKSLSALKALRKLSIAGCQDVSTLEALTACVNLQSLYMSDCDQVKGDTHPRDIL